jgi:PHD/YefM family antitoxin component YafN of YafNO toxin-antitoxin module
MHEIDTVIEAETNIEKILNGAMFHDETYVVNNNGKPAAIIMPYWMYEHVCEELGTKP